MEERLISFHEKLTEFLHQKLSLVLVIVGVFISIALIISGIKYYFQYKERKAGQLLLSASPQNSKVLKNLVEKYPSTRAGLEACLILFVQAYQKGNYKLAQKYLKIFKSHASSYFIPIANYGLGKIQEEKKLFDRAITIYQKNVKKLRPLDLYLYLDLARLSKKAGDLAAAKRYYQAVLSEFPDSGFSSLVKYELWVLQ